MLILREYLKEKIININNEIEKCALRKSNAVTMQIIYFSSFGLVLCVRWTVRPVAMWEFD